MSTVTIPQAVDLTNRFLAPDCAVLLVGPSGIGKTEVATEVARRRNVNFLASHPITAEPPDLRGYPHVNEDRQTASWIPIGIHAQLVDPNCPETIVLLDDIGQCLDEMQAAIMHLVLARRVGDADISPRVSFILATNGVEHAAGARPLLVPLLDRTFRLDCVFHPHALAKYVLHKPDVDPVIAAFALSRPDVFTTSFTRDGTSVCTPRGAVRLGRLLKRAGISAAEAPLPLVAGNIGAKAATDFRMVAEQWAEAADKTPPLPQFICALRDAMAGTIALMLVLLAAQKIRGRKLPPAYREALAPYGDWAELFDTLTEENESGQQL